MIPDKMKKIDQKVKDWRLSGNLVLLYSSYPTVASLEEDYMKFLDMEIEDQHVSNDESIRLFNKDNKERYEEMLNQLYSVPEPEYDEFKKSYFPPNKITIDPLDRLFLCREMAVDKDYLDKIDSGNYLKYIQEDTSLFELNHDKDLIKEEILTDIEQSNMIDDSRIVYPMLTLRSMANEDGDIIPEDKDHEKWLNSYKRLITIGDKTTYNSLFDWWKKTLIDSYNEWIDGRNTNNDVKTEKYKNILIKLGWIPGIDPSPETINKASINTKNKLEEILQKCTIIDASNINTTHSLADKTDPTYMYFMFVKLNGKYSNIICSNNKEFKDSLELGYNFSSNNCYATPVAQKHSIYGLEDRNCEIYAIYNNDRDRNYDFASIHVNNDTSDFNSPFDPLDGMDLNNSGAIKLFIYHFLNAYRYTPKLTLGDNGKSIFFIYKIYDGKVKDYLTDHAETNVEAVTYVINKGVKYKGLSEASITNEFPIEFDKEGNLIINKGKKLDIDGEYSRTHLALRMYEENKNITGMKYSICKLWYFNILLEDKIHNSKTSKEDKKIAIKQRAKVMNDIKKYGPIILKMDPNFNLQETYKKSPFNNDKFTISSSTVFYLFDTIKKLLDFKDLKKIFK